MKKILTTAILLSSSISALFAAEAKVLLITPEDTFSGFVISTDKRNILWRERANSTVIRKQRRVGTTVYFMQTPEFTEAMDLYKSRNYKDAAAKFAVAEEAYKKTDDLPGNPSTLAGFYQLECFRRMEDLDTLKEKAATFIPKNLLAENHRLQYDMYSVFWEAVRLKDWARVNSIASKRDWKDRKLPGNLRAQVAYCHGLALEGLGKPMEALIAYNNAFVADFSASERISRKSTNNCLRILLNDSEVKTTMKIYPTDSYSDNTRGASLIREGIGLVKLWDKSLGAGEKIPEEYKVFLKFPPKNR